MEVAERIYTLVKTMPVEQANAVLDFAEFLQHKSCTQLAQPPQPLSAYFGILKNSPHLNEDPVEIQRAMRREWD